MSNEEEKRCPLCAEEMDWTDQQFMPCKCGYQVCVWCWHHIIDMAEKDETEGRCPACRTIYEKEKIVAAQANCERTMTKISSRKTKPPKAKPKANEVKKDLTNVRVIQRKMAYVIGLPLRLADEDVLQRKEYFGQYGKVTKVSLSRTAGGTLQQFVNDSCSVYITYSKEEEAVRCIQSVHCFVLEGRLLRASFGTAKYCHAWLKNMPCNNPACLYLHSIGADEDSFGKDEVAAVHTRNRVQQIVGETNNLARRSGNVLPPPVDEMYNSTTNKSTIRSGASMGDFHRLDGAHGSANGITSATCTLPSKEKEKSTAIPNTPTTFVDVVGRSKSSAPEKDGNNPEDGRILNLCSELSSTTINGDMNSEQPYSVPSLFRISSSDHFGNGLFRNNPDESLREDSFLSDNHGSKDKCGSGHGSLFLHPSNTTEDSVDPALLHKKTHSVNGFTGDHNSVYNRQDEVSLPVICVNSILNESLQEKRFQTSSKSDRIYRSSKSFSNEEIVEHLRRIDGDNQINDGDNSVLDAVESSIISNIMSIDFDSGEDSLTMPNGLSELLDETDGLGGSSWSSLNSDQSGYSSAKQDNFVNQMTASILPEYGDNKEPFFCKPQYPASRAHSLAPPGFSMPSRDPPPGFSTSERTIGLPRPSSGSRLAGPSPFSKTLHQPSLQRLDNVDFFDPAILNYNTTDGQRANGLRNPSLPNGAPQLSPFDDESRLWLLMQQSSSSSAAHQDSKFSQMFAPQTPSISREHSYTHHMRNGSSSLDDIYGLSSRLVDERKNSNPSFFTQMSQQRYTNGHVSNNNGYRHSVDEAQHKGGVGVAEIQRNERLGGVEYLPGYGDLMFSSNDVYARVFGL